MPMREAAQVACVSQAFVRSWRCHPNLHFSKETLGLNKNTCQKGWNFRFFFERTAKDLPQFLLDEETKKVQKQEKTTAASTGVKGNTKT